MSIVFRENTNYIEDHYNDLQEINSAVNIYKAVNDEKNSPLDLLVNSYSGENAVGVYKSFKNIIAIFLLGRKSDGPSELIVDPMELISVFKNNSNFLNESELFDAFPDNSLYFLAPSYNFYTAGIILNKEPVINIFTSLLNNVNNLLHNAHYKRILFLTRLLSDLNDKKLFTENDKEGKISINQIYPNTGFYNKSRMYWMMLTLPFVFERLSALYLVLKDSNFFSNNVKETEPNVTDGATFLVESKEVISKISKANKEASPDSFVYFNENHLKPFLLNLQINDGLNSFAINSIIPRVNNSDWLVPNNIAPIIHTHKALKLEEQGINERLHTRGRDGNNGGNAGFSFFENDFTKSVENSINEMLSNESENDSNLSELKIYDNVIYVKLKDAIEINRVNLTYLRNEDIHSGISYDTSFFILNEEGKKAFKNVQKPKFIEFAFNEKGIPYHANLKDHEKESIRKHPHCSAGSMCLGTLGENKITNLPSVTAVLEVFNPNSAYIRDYEFSNGEIIQNHIETIVRNNIDNTTEIDNQIVIEDEFGTLVIMPKVDKAEENPFFKF